MTQTRCFAAIPIIDRIGRSLHTLPEKIREINFYHGAGETNTTHYGQEIFDNRIALVWNQVKTKSNFAQRRLEIAKYNPIRFS
jgi:xanthine dehydrogenase large subunit